MFKNAYENEDRAEAYARLKFPGTYYLAYRDLPSVFRKYVGGNLALDFGCGAGRSTRFLGKCGFRAVGIDIADEMLVEARKLDPDGDYRLIKDGDFSSFERRAYDLVFCGFPFDNIPSGPHKTALFAGLAGLLKKDGKLVLLGSTPEIYLHEWASFTTRAYPENQKARDGDGVRIINTATADPHPVEDIRCSDEAYRAIFREVGLEVVEMLKPLASPEEPYPWVNETRIAPWVTYVLSVNGVGMCRVAEICQDCVRTR